MATETKINLQNDEDTHTVHTGVSGSQFWCNFCDFRTNDTKEYLSHSCRDVLAERGVDIQPTGRNECS